MARVDLHPRAIHDAREARRFYGRASVALAIQFMDELDAAIARIAAAPQMWSPHLHGTRMCRLRRFPYHVVYAEGVAAVLVVAVAHNRRRPGYWRHRLP
jgi:plasmid stabilization system protein ParE